MRRIITITIFVLVASMSNASEKQLAMQTVCPVMGGPVNRNLYVDHAGKRIYMCCPSCKDSLVKDPQKYIEKMAANGQQPARIQTVCPVMGGKINKNVYVDHEGKRIYMCCAGCDLAFKKDPDKYIKKMKDAGIALDPAPVPKKKKE